LIEDFKIGFRFSPDETIVEIAKVELGNNYFSSLCFFLSFARLNLFLGKIILGFKILIIKFKV
jgi:hypothetical protein